MSRWLVYSSYEDEFVSETIEIDIPKDENLLNRLENIFNSLKKIEQDDEGHYKVTTEKIGNKYHLTVSQTHSYTSDEGTMPLVKDVLKRYNIGYREI